MTTSIEEWRFPTAKQCLDYLKDNYARSHTMFQKIAKVEDWIEAHCTQITITDNRTIETVTVGVVINGSYQEERHPCANKQRILDAILQCFLAIQKKYTMSLKKC